MVTEPEIGIHFEILNDRASTEYLTAGRDIENYPGQLAIPTHRRAVPCRVVLVVPPHTNFINNGNAKCGNNCAESGVWGLANDMRF